MRFVRGSVAVALCALDAICIHMYSELPAANKCLQNIVWDINTDDGC